MARKKIRKNHIFKDLPNIINFDCTWILQFGDNERDTHNIRKKINNYDPTVKLIQIRL